MDAEDRMLAEEGWGLMPKRHVTRAVLIVAFPAGPAILRPHCERSRATCPSRFAPNSQIDDGLLDVVLIEDLSTFGVLALLPRLIFTGELRTSHVRRWRAQRVRLTTHKPAMFHGDGEIIGPTPVEIEVVPRAVQVLAPAPT